MAFVFTALIAIGMLTSWKVAAALVAVGAGAIVVQAWRPPKFPDADKARALAAETADLLERGMRVADHHRDYCGMGLARIDGVFICDAVHDGEFYAPGEHSHDSSHRQEFRNKEEFVVWLQGQLMAHPLRETNDICFTRVQQFVEAYRRSESGRGRAGRSA